MQCLRLVSQPYSQTLKSSFYSNQDVLSKKEVLKSHKCTNELPSFCIALGLSIFLLLLIRMLLLPLTDVVIAPCGGDWKPSTELYHFVADRCYTELLLSQSV